MANFSISDKILNILVNIFLATLGWYWVFTDGDIISYIVALPFTLFTLIELRNYLKKPG